MKGNQRTFDSLRGFSVKTIAAPAKAKRENVNIEVMLANKMKAKSGVVGMKNENTVAK